MSSTPKEQRLYDWRGRSGKTYSFGVFPLGTPMRDQDGNYIFARRQADGTCMPIYIGQGNLRCRTDLEHHHKGPCIVSKGATEVHAHLNPSEPGRVAEEADILAAHSQAYEPQGCNERPGG